MSLERRFRILPFPVKVWYSVLTKPSYSLTCKQSQMSDLPGKLTFNKFQSKRQNKIITHWLFRKIKLAWEQRHSGIKTFQQTKITSVTQVLHGTTVAEPSKASAPIQVWVVRTAGRLNGLVWDTGQLEGHLEASALVTDLFALQWVS